MQLTVKGSYLGLAAHQEGFCLEDKNIYITCLCNDADMHGGDISYIVRLVGKERDGEY